jgi:hypothetical protein
MKKILFTLLLASICNFANAQFSLTPYINLGVNAKKYTASSVMNEHIDKLFSYSVGINAEYDIKYVYFGVGMAYLRYGYKLIDSDIAPTPSDPLIAKTFTYHHHTFLTPVYIGYKYKKYKIKPMIEAGVNLLYFTKVGDGGENSRNFGLGYFGNAGLGYSLTQHLELQCKFTYNYNRTSDAVAHTFIGGQIGLNIKL